MASCNGEPFGDRDVVGRDVRECARRPVPDAGARVRTTAFHGLDNIGVRKPATSRRRRSPLFFAADRTIAGPPMSICSMHPSKSAPERNRLGETDKKVADQQIERLNAEVGQLLSVRI